ncbi:MAG: hypothetical protein HY814_11445 [Candidatus Riflebacteria bacterium]|nr:hypothetical protein [Candidatus Riflebacteria bacterium]
MAELQRRLLMARSPSERVEMACSMFDTAVALALAFFRQQRPGASLAEERKFLFLRFYGAEFSPDVQARVLENIERVAACQIPGTGDIPAGGVSSSSNQAW